MNPTAAGYLYLIAAVLFVVGLKRLSSPATAKDGNRIAALGMLVAIVVTLLDQEVVGYGLVATGLVVGGAVGVVLANRVEMTSMPQLVTAFNGFGGGASAFVALAELGRGDQVERTLITISLSIVIGSMTLSGSLVAFGKLQDLITGRPIVLPGQIVLDIALLAAALTSSVLLVLEGSTTWGWCAFAATALLGITRTLPIGGADMPVVISFLNSLSGLAAAATGFVIESNALIVSGALVGASGLILTRIMVAAMNRTLAGVLFSAFGASTDTDGAVDGERVARRASAEDVAITLAYAQRVVVVPGYGLAVAQAQHVARELADLLQARNVEVRYAIHPVAGRMPGHMNVLLAEADVPYDQLYDLEDINPEFAHTDVALIVGANDVVNPLARQPNTPVSGMPILDADRATTVIVVKRSLSSGFAGIDNPLFYLDNTLMLFADAKQGLADVVSAVRGL
ncbi:MAG: NAD(P)(+) transhydrogenase (Re/Si-specific) subunit beta [Ilumatobacteraceae bacterium]